MCSIHFQWWKSQKETDWFFHAQTAGQLWMELIADMYWLCFSSLVISFAAVKVKFDLKTDISNSANPKKYQDGTLQIDYLTTTFKLLSLGVRWGRARDGSRWFLIIYMDEKIIILGSWTMKGRFLEWIDLSYGKSDLIIQQKVRSVSTYLLKEGVLGHLSKYWNFSTPDWFVVPVWGSSNWRG